MHNIEKNKLEYVYGIRGIASILVVLCHLACVFLPGLYFFEQANTSFEKIWILTPLNIITNGNAAVQCFFVLSGFLITRKVYNKEKLSDPTNTYKKLLHVVIPGVIFAALLMAFGQMYHLRALELNNTFVFVNTYNNFSVSIIDVLKDIFIKTFLTGSNYVGPFWTIKVEMIGAILITAISYFIFEHVKKRKISYILFGILCYIMNPMLFPFIAGAFIYECVYSKNLKNEKNILNLILTYISNNKLILFFIFLFGMYLFSIDSYMSSIWMLFNFLPATIIRTIGFSICLFCIHESKLLKKILSLRPLKFLGTISAYIYAFHWPIILSLGCGLYLLLQGIPYYLAVSIISIVVLITTILLSFGYIKLYPMVAKQIKNIFPKYYRNKSK